jgi:outer membrane protein OmpA-like peptidoglycan-associated protein/tetratricopeptide (TPR) repeat protein
MYRLKTLYTFCLLLAAASAVQAQQNIMTHLSSPEKRGDKMFFYFSYAAAVDDYLLALKNDPEKDHLKLKIAECYRMLNHPAEAEKWYAEAMPNTGVVKPEHKFHYAQALSSNEKYEEAKKWFTQYQTEVSGDSRSARKIEALENIDDLFKDSVSCIVTPLTINSPAADFSPAFYTDGIVFVSARSQNTSVKNVFSWNKSNFLDLYLSKGAENSTNATPELFHKNVNTNLHEGPTVFYEERKKMIFTRNNLMNGKKGESKKGIVKLKLYYSELTGNDWSKPTSLPFNSSEYSVGHPAISSDGKTLYFISDMPGGQGGTDLYKSEWQNGNWGKPINMGPEINTEGNEMFPFLHRNNVLYFASNGHGGLGGLDIFSTHLAHFKVTNLGAPINSNADDFGLILYEDERYGYFSSNRKGSAGDDDLYHFKIKREMMEISVVDKETGKDIPGASVSVLESETVIHQSPSNENGLASFALNPRKNYRVKVQKDSYLPAEGIIDETDLQKKDSLLIKIPLEKIKPGAPMPSPGDTVGNKVNFTRFGKISSIETDRAKPVAPQSPAGAKAPQTVRIYQLINLSGIVQELVAINKRTYLIDNDERALLNLKGEMVTHWEIELPLKVSKRKEAIREYLTGLGFIVEFVEVHNIYYDYNKSLIRDDASKDLNLVAQLLHENPELNILLGSHTDSRGTDVYNTTLATQRALTARAYLAKRGIAIDRILQAAFGEKQLVNGCGNAKGCNEGAHQSNRRTEFKVMFRK